MQLPMLARNLLESIELSANVTRLLADRCVEGLEADEERCLAYAEGSPSIVTPLNRFLGYEEAAAVAKQSLTRSVRPSVRWCWSAATWTGARSPSKNSTRPWMSLP